MPTEPRLTLEVFVVNRKPDCVCDWFLPVHTRQFLHSIDGNYFSYVAQLHSNNLNSTEDSRRAAITIRTAYFHAIETFFTLVGAALQAPRCMFAWIPRASMDDVRDIIREITFGSKRVFNQWGLDKVSWISITNSIFSLLTERDNTSGSAISAFPDFWAGLAEDFLKEENQLEYNGVKHGFRNLLGGTQLTVSPTEQPSTEPVLNFGGEHGSAFLVPTSLRSSNSKKRDHVFYMRTIAVNWAPELLVRKIDLLAISIENLKAFLLTLANSKELGYRFPSDPGAFNFFCENRPSLLNFTVDLPVNETHLRRPTQSELLQHLRTSKKCRNVPDSELSQGSPVNT